MSVSQCLSRGLLATACCWSFAGSLWQLPSVTAGPPEKPAPEFAGLMLDDSDGQYTGAWEASSRQPPYVGTTYRHDDNREQGQKSVRFAPQFDQAGDYEVRLIYTPHPNRASRVQVTIASAAASETTVYVNQQTALLTDNVPAALGTFRFEAGAGGSVAISNTNADGYVVVDAVQFVPTAIAQAERRGERDSGFRERPVIQKPASSGTTADSFASLRAQNAATVAFSPLGAIRQPAADGSSTEPADLAADDEPVQLARDVPAAQVDGREFDLVVVGGTAGGVACAVRAAREGCSVLLVQHNRHIGGMMTNGLMQWDALYGGHRSPLFSELLANIETHYIRTCGENSEDHQTIRFTHQHYPIGWAEPRVAEREFNRLIAAEPQLSLLLNHFPIAVERHGNLLRSVTLQHYDSGEQIRVQAASFADATYEGDLFALAHVPYRVGREAREEYGEPHAGILFCNIAGGPAPQDAVEGRLNIRPYGSHQGSIDPTSPFTADGAVQAYNYRFCVTKAPANRIMLTEPPPGYDRDEYVNYNRKSIATNAGPRLKSHMNSPILPGENHAYPEADWPTREKIIERHLNFALGLIWFLQNDESVPLAKRESFRQWGLPKDEFQDNGHVPYEMYVREARRIVGRHVYTEHDNSLAEGLGRTPLHPDAVAITDWYMDSHACTTDSRPGYHYDGKLILTEESRPGQIPYRSLLPQGVDNLLVPVCLSATHIAWGAVRLEPVWMQTGESAGFAAALAKQTHVAPAQLDRELLARTLADHRFVLSFFNDVNAAGGEAWIPAVEYFGTRGFFPTYDARPDDSLTAATARAWAGMLATIQTGAHDPLAAARVLHKQQENPAELITAGEFVRLLKEAWMAHGLPVDDNWSFASARQAPENALSRAAACEFMYSIRAKD